MKRNGKFTPEVREEAVRLVLETEAAHDSQWAAIEVAADTIGCTPGTLRRWIIEAERDAGMRTDRSRAAERRLEAMQRKALEIERANHVLRRISELFAPVGAARATAAEISGVGES